MTVSLSPVTVANSIANIAISGVTVKSIGGIPPNAQLLTPILFPQPNGFITDILVENQSFGTNAIAAINFSYSLHYVFLFAELGSGVNQLDIYSTLIQKLEVIWEAIITNDQVTGLIDLKLNSVDGLGEIEDPAGNVYWGALFSFRCMEFAQ